MTSDAPDNGPSARPAVPRGEPGNVMLIGPRCCGKTTIGVALAAATGLRFVDLDDLTRAELGSSSVHEAWQRYGEPGWRRAEVRVLDRVLGDRGQVIALGGGTPMIDAARQMIVDARRRDGLTVFYLQCRAEVLSARLAAAPGDRPSLTGQPVHEEIAAVLAEREPTYQRLADVVLAGDGDDPAAIVAQISDRVEPARRRSGDDRAAASG